MSSKIKVDTIENVAGSGNVSLGSGHNLVVPGNITGQGTTTLTGNLTVDTNTLHVDTSNNRVGIGTASPTQDLTIVNSGSARVELVSGTSGTSIIDMGDSSDKDIGGIRYLQASDTMQFRAGNDVRMTIDSNGHVLKPNQVAFVAAGNNGSYIQTSPVPFPTVVLNVGNGYNNSNYTFTAPIAGTYFFHFHCGIVNGAANQQIYPYFQKNGQNIMYSYTSIATTYYSQSHMTALFSMAASDTMKVVMATPSSSATYYNNSQECRFNGYLLG